MHTQRFPDHLIETIRSRTDLIAVVSRHLALKKSGRNFTGLCPFHAEKTPSFVVNPEKQFYHCFGCSEGGDVFHFLSKIEQITFPEAVRRLADAAGMTLPSIEKKGSSDSETERIYRINEEAATFFHESLISRREADPARRYLKQRGLSEETLRTFCIGFAVPCREYLMKRMGVSSAFLEKAGLIRAGENGVYDTFRGRILFPIKTVEGSIVGFGGRALDDRPPKYLNTPETPVFTKGKYLYGLDRARGQRSLIMVEGYFDAIMLHQNGISNVVATLGTAITPDHLHLIRRHIEKVSLVFDPDTAGQAALFRSAPLFIERGLAAHVLTLPSGEDPDLFVRRQGQAAFLNQVQQAQPLLDFAIQHAALQASSSGNMKALQELFALIQKIPSNVEQGEAIRKMAESFNVHEKDIRADFDRFRKHRASTTGEKAIEKRTEGSPASANVHAASSRIPQDEETVLALMIQDRLGAEALSDLRPGDFMTPSLAPFVAALWDGPAESWYRPQDCLHRLADREKPLFTRLSVLDIPHENEEKIKTDCLRSMKNKRLQRESLKVQKELKAAERRGDRAQTDLLLHTFLNLKKEQLKMALL